MKKLFTLFSQNLLFKIVFSVLLTIVLFNANAQKEVESAKTYLSENALKQKLALTDIAEMNISSQYLSPTTGWYHIYFNQTYQSVDVFNGLLNVTLKDGEVFYVGNNFVQGIASKAPIGAINLNLSPLEAIQKAAANVNIPLSETQVRYANLAARLIVKDYSNLVKKISHLVCVYA
jgi:hypothetical protein